MQYQPSLAVATPFGKDWQQGQAVQRNHRVSELNAVTDKQAALDECDVLVVEDDRGIRGMIAEALADEGYSVAVAAHGRDALDQLTQLAARLIILDIMMPIMDGNALYRELQADERYQAIPIIVMSAAHNLQLLAGAQQVVALLPKPFVLAALLNVVEQQLGLP